MKGFGNFVVAMSVAAFGMSALLSSCVKSGYEISQDNLNLDVTLFEEGVVFPIGNAVNFTLGELYDEDGNVLKDYLQNQSGGDEIIELDKDFKAGIAVTAEDIPEMIIGLLVSGDVGLGGKVVNGLPLQFDIEFQLLDPEGNVVPLEEGLAFQVIKPCMVDGTPQETELTAVQSIKPVDDDQEIAAIRLLFMVNGFLPGAAQFDENSSLQTDLAALIHNGININLDELFSGIEDLTDEEEGI
jgi:hypothetical protein